jgi:hypothetical protein
MRFLQLISIHVPSIRPSFISVIDSWRAFSADRTVLRGFWIPELLVIKQSVYLKLIKNPKETLWHVTSRRLKAVPYPLISCLHAFVCVACTIHSFVEQRSINPITHYVLFLQAVKLHVWTYVMLCYLCYVMLCYVCYVTFCYVTLRC